MPGTDRLPQIDRTDVGIAVVGSWEVHATEQQQIALDAAAEQWRHVQWPDGLLTHSVLGAENGTGVLHYSQALTDEAFSRFDKQRWAAGVDAAVTGGIERRGVTPYHLYRSLHTGASGEPGCVVIVVFRADDTKRAAAWVDGVVDASHPDTTPTGMLSAHFHISRDGSRILNYAEWTDAASHEAAVQVRPQRRDTDVVKAVDDTPGVEFISATRYLTWRNTSAPDT